MGRSFSLRSWFAAALVVVLLLSPSTAPVHAQTSVMPPQEAVDLAFTAFAALFRGPMDVVTEAQERLRDALTMAAVAGRVVADPANDVHGTVPSTLPPGLSDIRNELTLNLPASAGSELTKACESSQAPQLDPDGNLQAPPNALWFCPSASTTEQPLTVIALQLGSALPDALALQGQQAMYIGLGRPDPAQQTRTDSFHVGLGDIWAAGLRHTGAWVPYFEGGALFPQLPVVALTHDVEGAVALMVAPTGLLANGFRPFVAIAGPPKGIGDGSWDQVDATSPSHLLFPTQTPDEALTAILGALGGDAATGGTQVKSYFVPPLAFGLDGATAREPLDPLWAAIGRLDRPGSAPTIDQQFPCAQQPNAVASIACAQPPASVGTSLTEGTVAVFEADLAVPPPSGTVGGPLEIDVALDADGKANDNWKATVDQSGDPLQGTDRVYAATEDPSTGIWSLAVQQLAGSNWSDVASAARVVVDGPSVVFLVPAADFTDPHPGWRLIERAQDATTSPSSDMFLVSTGSPIDHWSLAPTDDPSSVVAVPIAVTGGCVVAQAGVVPTLHWSVTIAGLDQVAFPRLVVTLTIPLPPGSGKKSITANVAPVPVNGGRADFLVQVLPARIRLNRAVVETGTKSIDVTRSWQHVFGSSLTVTAKGGQHAGNSCS